MQSPLNEALLQFLILICLVSALYWGAAAKLMRVSPGAALRITLGNLLLVLGIWFSVYRTSVSGDSYLLFQGGGAAMLGGLTLYRIGSNMLMLARFRTSWVHWGPVLAYLALCLPMAPNASSNDMRTVVFSLAGAWISLMCFRDCLVGLHETRASLVSRVAIGWPFALAGVALLVRSFSAFFQVIGSGGNPAGAPPGSETGFLWVICALLLAFNYTMGMLAGTRLVRRIQELAERDYLTGCYNRRATEVRHQHEVKRSERSGGALACVLWDLDHFKRINDTFGHGVGDSALRHAVTLADDVIRKVDVLGRYGGEEFLLVLPDTSVQGAQSTAERIRSALEATPLMHEQQSITVTASFGVALLRPGELPAGVVKRADDAMYRAKKQGRNQVVVADEDSR